MKKRMVLILVIGILALGTGNLLLGNPLSCALADRAAKQYIKTQYAQLDLAAEKSEYSWKGGSYMVFLAQPGSEDIRFLLEFNSLGALLRDEYTSVAFNTQDRFDALAKETVPKLLAPHFPAQTLISVSAQAGEGLPSVPPDQAASMQSFPYELQIYLRLATADRSMEAGYAALCTVRDVLHAQGLSVASFYLALLPAEGSSAAGDLSTLAFVPKAVLEAENPMEALLPYASFEAGE